MPCCITLATFRRISLQLGQLGAVFRGRVEEGQGVAGAGEDAVEGVIIPGGDRVELVVVAAGAGQGQAEERLAQDVDLAVVLGRPVLAEVDRRVDPLVEPVEAGPQHRLVGTGDGVAARPRAGGRPRGARRRTGCRGHPH